MITTSMHSFLTWLGTRNKTPQPANHTPAGRNHCLQGVCTPHSPASTQVDRKKSVGDYAIGFNVPVVILSQNPVPIFSYNIFL